VSTISNRTFGPGLGVDGGAVSRTDGAVIALVSFASGPLPVIVPGTAFEEAVMLTFLSNNWLWIVFLGGMLLMHLGHRHGGAAGGHGAGCGGGHGDHSGAPQGDTDHRKHTDPGDDVNDVSGRSLVRPPVS
jgi:hypothetical protein